MSQLRVLPRFPMHPVTCGSESGRGRGRPVSFHDAKSVSSHDIFRRYTDLDTSVPWREHAIDNAKSA